jgi:hypothetical protein
LRLFITNLVNKLELAEFYVILYRFAGQFAITVLKALQNTVVLVIWTVILEHFPSQIDAVNQGAHAGPHHFHRRQQNGHIGHGNDSEMKGTIELARLVWVPVVTL